MILFISSYTCTYLKQYLYSLYMKIHVPSMLARDIETINKQTQQTSSHNGLENS